MIKIQRTTEPQELTNNKARWKKKYLEALESYNTNNSVQNKRNKEKFWNKK